MMIFTRDAGTTRTTDAHNYLLKIISDMEFKYIYMN